MLVEEGILFEQLATLNSWPCAQPSLCLICLKTSSNYVVDTSQLIYKVYLISRIPRWSLLTDDDDDNSTYTESSIVDNPNSSRKLLGLRHGGGGGRGLEEEEVSGSDNNAAATNQRGDAQTEDTSTEIHVARKSRIDWNFLVSKMLSSLCIYITCCFLHAFTVKLIRLFKPNAKLPFILTFPKPQVHSKHLFMIFITTMWSR